jgi:hypothetical protein
MTNLLGYIDPGSTALIWQILAGVFVSIGVVFSIWWRKICTFFKGIWVKIFGGKKKARVVSEAELEVADGAPEKAEADANGKEAPAAKPEDQTESAPNEKPKAKKGSRA